MYDLLAQLGMPGVAELVFIALSLAIAAVPAGIIYWDASRRREERPLVWAIAMFFAAWTLVGIVVVGLLYYFVVVNDDPASGS